MINFDNPTIASLDEVSKLKVEDLKVNCSKSGKEWIAIAYAETEEKIIVCALSYGKNPKKVLKEVLSNAIQRIQKEIQICC